MIRVKICGITTNEDAAYAVYEGVSALGFNFYPKSPRYIDPDKAAKIIAGLPPFVSAVGLFVNEAEETVSEIVNVTGIDTLQFHGDESPEYCDLFSHLRTIKAFRIQTAKDLEKLAHFDVNAYLLDSYHPEQYGGTGLSFAWQMLESVDSVRRSRLVIAGGISPDNVGQLMGHIKPYAIDLCSGVEHSPGVKDHSLVSKLMNEVNNL